MDFEKETCIQIQSIVSRLLYYGFFCREGAFYKSDHRNGRTLACLAGDGQDKAWMNGNG